MRNRGWKPVPYSDDDKKFMGDNLRQMRDFFEDLFAQEEREQIMEWRGSNDNPVSMHYDADRKEIYFKVLFQRQGHSYKVSDLRRPTAEEKKEQPDVYAVLDNGEHRRGLTKERYLVLRAKLV